MKVKYQTSCFFYFQSFILEAYAKNVREKATIDVLLDAGGHVLT